MDVNPMSRRTPESGYLPAAARAHPSHAEDAFTRVLEERAARVPSAFFLVAAAGALLVSAAFELSGNTRASRFVGMWVPTLLITGVYNKLVKIFGTS